MKYLSDFASLRETIKHRMETFANLCVFFYSAILCVKASFEALRPMKQEVRAGKFGITLGGAQNDKKFQGSQL